MSKRVLSRRKKSKRLEVVLDCGEIAKNTEFLARSEVTLSNLCQRLSSSIENLLDNKGKAGSGIDGRLDVVIYSIENMRT